MTKTVAVVDWQMLKAARLKYRGLVREIESHDTYPNMLHSVYKLGSFLADALPDAWKLADEENNERRP